MRPPDVVVDLDHAPGTGMQRNGPVSNEPGKLEAGDDLEERGVQQGQGTKKPGNEAQQRGKDEHDGKGGPVKATREQGDDEQGQQVQGVIEHDAPPQDDDLSFVYEVGGIEGFMVGVSGEGASRRIAPPTIKLVADEPLDG